MLTAAATARSQARGKARVAGGEAEWYFDFRSLERAERLYILRGYSAKLHECGTARMLEMVRRKVTT